jgi:hypothetical protein
MSLLLILDRRRTSHRVRKEPIATSGHSETWARETILKSHIDKALADNFSPTEAIYHEGMCPAAHSMSEIESIELMVSPSFQLITGFWSRGLSLNCSGRPPDS